MPPLSVLRANAEKNSDEWKVTSGKWKVKGGKTDGRSLRWDGGRNDSGKWKTMSNKKAAERLVVTLLFLDCI